jgi:uncharacterized iron-regulated protein
MKMRLFSACISLAFSIGCTTPPQKTSAVAQCPAPATWSTFRNGTLQAATEQTILREAVRGDVVLIGEHHDNADHHLWQLQTLAALHLLRPQMIVGFEAFPRRVQPVLDDWTAGRLTQQQFLERVDWAKTWNVPAALYLPLFQFARLNRIPMAALNVERTLISEIGTKGWNAIPEMQREGLSRAATASSAYEDALFEAYKQHTTGSDKRVPVREDSSFRRFVEAQTTWDRAMAEALATRVKGSDGARPLVVGIMGSGHVEYGHGVAHQLRDLGISNIATLLPIDAKTLCTDIKPALADAVFAVPADPRDRVNAGEH